MFGLQASGFPIAIIGLLILLIIGATNGFKLRIARFNIASDKGSGMDGGLWGVLAFGGGEFRIKICNQVNSICCETSQPLETTNDDWERSESNFFVGKSLQECENFSAGGVIALTLIHMGSDGGKIESVEFFGSDFGYGQSHRKRIVCPVGVKLDGYTSHTFNCELYAPVFNVNASCNGDEGFCSVPYNNYTFLGSHNAGTGEDTSSIPQVNCAFKNQDLDIKEQLDFGVRMFDFDVIKSEKLYNCDGLETGHGRYPGLGIYRCFGRMESILEELLRWLNITKNRDVVTLYFGAIDFESDTYPALLELFNKPHIKQRLNTDFKRTGNWPTLGQAIEDGRNIFVFMRVKECLNEEYIVREVPFKSKDLIPVYEGDVVVTSTFQNGKVGEDCESTVEQATTFCQNKGDLLKVAAFGNGFSELQCLWKSARQCNPRLKDVLEACKSATPSSINFVQMDFPNYLGLGGQVPIDVLMEHNSKLI